ncbi:MAG: histidine phosphatase family protein [Chloroflexi bacterium]|nr:histidine phosphatase family protein [Chloroflexota bacterium]
MTRLFLIRHGRSTWNAERRIQGRADPPLDEVGQEQARRLAERLRDDPPVALYTSPQRRAQETADIIGQALGISVAPDERLREYDVGDITGLTWKQVEEQYPDVARRWTEASEDFTLPGEEGRAPFRTRVAAALDEIIARHVEETIGVVAHGGTLGTYLNHLIGLPSRFSPFSFGNGSLSVVEVNPVRPRILLLNDTCHLGGEV